MNPTCRRCGVQARSVWVESAGLTESNVNNVLDTDTLLKDNTERASLCADCCIAGIADALGSAGISCLEVCSPRGHDIGFVLPMQY